MIGYSYWVLRESNRLLCVFCKIGLRLPHFFIIHHTPCLLLSRSSPNIAAPLSMFPFSQRPTFGICIHGYRCGFPRTSFSTWAYLLPNWINTHTSGSRGNTFWHWHEHKNRYALFTRCKHDRNILNKIQPGHALKQKVKPLALRVDTDKNVSHTMSTNYLMEWNQRKV